MRIAEGRAFEQRKELVQGLMSQEWLLCSKKSKEASLVRAE